MLGNAVPVDGAGIQTFWSRGYDSPRDDAPVALLRDSQNDVGVLVDSFGELAVVKYSASGTARWTNRFDSPLYDTPLAFAVDSNDSFYVTVVSTTNSLPGPLRLIKYASNGTLLWERAGDISNAEPKSPAVSVSPGVTTDASNNVFIAVVTPGAYSMLKYDADGTRLWATNHPIETGSFASTRYFGVDGAGNAVLVAALTRLGNDRILVLKCSPSGALTARVHEWPAPNDFLTAATVDSAGTMYVAGSVVPPGSWAYHIFTAKYDAAGALVWSNKRPPANGYHAVSRQLVLDGAGNIIVTAYEQRPVSEDDDEIQTLTLKYGPSGGELWSARAPGFYRSPTGLAVDTDGNSYVVSGDSFGGGVFLAKYRPNGSQAAEAIVSGQHSPGHIVTGAPGEFYLNLSRDVETRKFVHVDSAAPLSVTITPGSTEALPGASVTFTAVVSGVGPFTYDWRYFGYRIGATNPTLTLTNVQYQWRSHGDYSVIVSNLTESVVSPEARLSVLRAPTVQVTPATQYVVAGEPAAITAAASGTEPFTFSWYFNGQLVPGENRATLAIPTATAGNAGGYTVVVSNRAGIVTSTPATIYLVLPPMSFANPATIAVGTNGVANPYPSEVLVSGITNLPVKLTVTVEGLTSAEPSALAVVLQAPNGTALALMSDVAEDVVAEGVTLTFDDEAPGYVTDEYLASGTYLPGLPGPISLPPPASFSGWVISFGELLSSNPNGTWRLFVANAGYGPLAGPSSLTGGWRLTFLPPDPNAVIRASISEIKREGDQIVIGWPGAAGWKLQWSDSPNGPQWTDVSASQGATQTQVPRDSPRRFFRLVK